MWLLTNLFIYDTITKHIKEPTKIPPKVKTIKSQKVPKNVKSFPFRIDEKTIKKTAAVPSFSKLSPSNSTLNCLLVPISFKSATTATGSVAEIIEEKVNAADHPSYEV